MLPPARPRPIESVQVQFVGPQPKPNLALLTDDEFTELERLMAIATSTDQPERIKRAGRFRIAADLASRLDTAEVDGRIPDTGNLYQEIRNDLVQLLSPF